MAINQDLPLVVIQALLAKAETQMLRPGLLDIPTSRWKSIQRPAREYHHQQLVRPEQVIQVHANALTEGMLGTRTSL